MTSLQGKVVFISGGARGIGAELARRLRNKGAKMVLIDLDKGELPVLRHTAELLPRMDASRRARALDQCLQPGLGEAVAAVTAMLMVGCPSPASDSRTSP